MKKLFYISLVLLSYFCVNTAYGLETHSGFVNKDLKNKGPDAKDLTVILSGSETIPAWYHFDGYSSGPKRGTFSTFNSGPNPPNTELSWRNFYDGSDTTINTNQVIHVGWGTADGDCSILDMWWTDAAGQRIPGSVVYNLNSKWTYNTALKQAKAIWHNRFDPNVGGRQTITISNVYYAVLAQPLPLENLNAEDSNLAAALVPLPGGTTFDVPFDQNTTITIPVDVEPGSAVVLRYEVSAPGSSAESTDFTQFVSPPVIPTVSQWGLIIMAGLLLVVGAIVVRQRFKTTTV